MTEYQVKWTIDVEAKNFQEAAEKALAIQRDPDSIATVFEVYKDDMLIHTIDLSAEDDESEGLLCSYCKHPVEKVYTGEFKQLLYRNFGTNSLPLCGRCRGETATVWSCQCQTHYIRKMSEKACPKCDVLQPEDSETISIRDMIQLEEFWKKEMNECQATRR